MGIVVEPKGKKQKQKDNMYQQKKSMLARKGEWYLPEFSTPTSSKCTK
jgi:hypothetical protein